MAQYSNFARFTFKDGNQGIMIEEFNDKPKLDGKRRYGF